MSIGSPNYPDISGNGKHKEKSDPQSCSAQGTCWTPQVCVANLMSFFFFLSSKIFGVVFVNSWYLFPSFSYVYISMYMWVWFSKSFKVQFLKERTEKYKGEKKVVDCKC